MEGIKNYDEKDNTDQKYNTRNMTLILRTSMISGLQGITTKERLAIEKVIIIHKKRYSAKT